VKDSLKEMLSSFDPRPANAVERRASGTVRHAKDTHESIRELDGANKRNEEGSRYAALRAVCFGAGIIYCPRPQVQRRSAGAMERDSVVRCGKKMTFDRTEFARVTTSVTSASSYCVSSSVGVFGPSRTTSRVCSS
jgi:hypothetical protein